MNLSDFRPEYLEDAMRIALANYESQRIAVPHLPHIAEIPIEPYFLENDLGIASFEGRKLIGYLLSTQPFAHAFRSTPAVGVFSPIHTNGAISDNHAEIYARMYEAAGAKWTNAGATSHGISLYAQDTSAHMQLFRYGFGMRCVDAIRGMAEIPAPACTGIEIALLDPEECDIVYPLECMLDSHMTLSPTFMLRPSEPRAAFLESAMQPETRFFLARCNGEVAAFLKVERTGETFLCDTPDYIHVSGAYCLPQYRGRGIQLALINHAIRVLRGEGYTRLGVDFESINPAAHHFWLKYFQAYTYSVVRRIDEDVVTKAQLRAESH